MEKLTLLVFDVFYRIRKTCGNRPHEKDGLQLFIITLKIKLWLMNQIHGFYQ
jgi:hypothetical protein